MPAKRSLTEQEKLSIISAITFTHSAVIYLKACLPVVREEDATQLQSLIDLGELALRRLQKYFHEVQTGGGGEFPRDERATPKDESPIERELRRLDSIRLRMIECSDGLPDESAAMLQGRVKSWADELGKVAEAIRAGGGQ